MKKGCWILSSIFLALCFLAIPISANEPFDFSFEESEVGFAKSGLSEEAAKELFGSAEIAAEMFSASGAYHPARYHLPDDGTGKPVPEGTPEKITVNGVSYLLIPYGYNTEDRMLAYLKTLFTEETAKEIFASEELGGKNQPRRYPVFINRDGFLYESERKLTQNPSGEIKARCKRIVDEENRIVYRAETYLVSRMYFSQWERIPSSVSFDYVLEKQDGKWIFTSFKLPYYLALDSVTPISPQTGDSAVFLLPAAAISLCGILLAAKKRRRTS